MLILPATASRVGNDALGFSATTYAAIREIALPPLPRIQVLLSKTAQMLLEQLAR